MRMVYRARVIDKADFDKVLFEQYSLNKEALQMQLNERYAHYTFVEKEYRDAIVSEMTFWPLDKAVRY